MLNAFADELRVTMKRYSFAGAFEYRATFAPTAATYCVTASSSIGSKSPQICSVTSANQTSASPTKMFWPLCGFGANGVFVLRGAGGDQAACAYRFIAV